MKAITMADQKKSRWKDPGGNIITFAQFAQEKQ
jgi:hypothetical protein